MSERNNIDRLFQEKFKDFEVAPPEHVWNNIQSKMSKKEKNFNVLPLFLILSGFAAVVIIGLSVTNTFRFNPFNFGSETVTKKENVQEATDANSSVVFATEKDNNVNAPAANEVQTASESRSGIYNEESTPSTVVNPRQNKNPMHNPVVVNRKSETDNTRTGNEKNTVTKQTNTLQPRSGQISAFAKDTEGNTTDGKLIEDKTTESKVAENSKTTEDKQNAGTESDWLYENNSQSKIAYETRNNHPRNTTGKEEPTADRQTVSKNAIATARENNSTERNRNNEVTFVSTTSKDVVAKDSIAMTTGEIVEVVTPEEAEEKSKEEKKKEHKIIVSTLFSPVYMNLNGYGSALDAKFNDNSKSYRTSMSYGVGIMYPINNRWSVRTGVNVLNFEYNTNNIVFYESQSGAGLQYVDENSFGSGVAVSNTNPKGIPQDAGQVVTTLHSGELNQRIGYVEVPMEVSYKILNKRFTVDVIGGFSSMFLNDNRVSLVSSTTNTTIGEANNLNKVHFSSNVGVGLRYGFLKSFQANFEPMFKYQFNTFSSESGNFKPYFFGLYTGLSYRF